MTGVRGLYQQLREPAVSAASSGAGCGGGTAGHGHADRASVAGSTVAGSAAASQHLSASPAAAGNEGLPAAAAAPADRAAPQQTVGAVRLADLWRAGLEARGWSPAARGQFPLCLAKSTLDTYDRYINLFRNLCEERGVDFPQSNSAIVADFLVTQCGMSDRPHSALRCISAALAAMYEAFGVVSTSRIH